MSSLPALTAPAGKKSENLILVTADGLRWQELFYGIDPALMNVKDIGLDGERGSALRQKLAKPTPEESRSALMPFFWNTLAGRGVVMGDVRRGSPMQVTNAFHNSYPGYSELLTGRAQDDVIRGNKLIQNPSPTLLQVLKKHWKLPREQAAVFASWNVFSYACENVPGDLYINAGYTDSLLPRNSARVTELNALQKQALYTEETSRHDAFTFGLAMEYLKAVQPKLFYIAFDETDDWAHISRYDRVLQMIQYTDAALEQLWTFLQSSSRYRDKTTLIFTCDHGRGSTKEDWSGHGSDVPGSEHTWVGFFGPDTPARGSIQNVGTFYHRDIAATALALLGIEPAVLPGMLGSPIPLAIT